MLNIINQLVNYYDKVYNTNYICKAEFQAYASAITVITLVKHNIMHYGFDYGNELLKH